MKLSELATESGVTTASIKYYIHAGILPPGRKKNATTAVYDGAHLHRLALIMWLRSELGASIEAISDLTRAIDDPVIRTIDLMGMCQEFTLRTSTDLPASALPNLTPAEAVDSAKAVDGEEADGGDGEDAPPPRRHEELVTEVLTRLGWPDEDSAARQSLERTLKATKAAGYPVDVDMVVDHCRALTAIARTNIRPIGIELSRDEVCLHVIRGITVHNRQLIATSALVHASLSIMARESHE